MDGDELAAAIQAVAKLLWPEAIFQARHEVETSDHDAMPRDTDDPAA